MHITCWCEVDSVCGVRSTVFVLSLWVCSTVAINLLSVTCVMIIIATVTVDTHYIIIKYVYQATAVVAFTSLVQNVTEISCSQGR